MLAECAPHLWGRWARTTRCSATKCLCVGHMPVKCEAHALQACASTDGSCMLLTVGLCWVEHNALCRPCGGGQAHAVFMRRPALSCSVCVHQPPFLDYLLVKRPASIAAPGLANPPLFSYLLALPVPRYLCRPTSIGSAFAALPL